MVFNMLPAYGFKKNSFFSIIRSLCLIFLVFSLIALYWNQISETVMFQRLFRLSDELEGGKRVSMYSEAIEFFLRSSLLGVGFANYAMHSKFGMYSHSTYAEALSCTGIIGTVLYFGSYVIMAINIFKAYSISKKNNNEREIITIKLLFCLFLVMLFTGVGTVLFYDIKGMIFMALIIGHNNKIFKANASSAQKNKHRFLLGIYAYFKSGCIILREYLFNLQCFCFGKSAESVYDFAHAAIFIG